MIYAMCFAIALTFFNIKILKDKFFGRFNIWLNVFMLLLFLMICLVSLNQLHQTELTAQFSDSFHRTGLNAVVRYISLLAAFGLLFALYRITVEDFIQPFIMNISIGFDVVMHIFLIVVIGSEMLSWISHDNNDSSRTLGLSILWGLYSLMLIIMGILQKQKHLRVMAIALFGITLFKLAFYDTAHLGTVAKTFVFVALGLMLLLISFLYNKFKDSMMDENPE
jgi:uncharacterized membrane protein